MTHSFTVTFGAKYFTSMVTTVPPNKTFSLIKKKFFASLQKSLRKFKFLRYVTFRSRWSCEIQFHKYDIHINGDF